MKKILEKGIQTLVVPTYLVLMFDILLKLIGIIFSLTTFPTISEWINGALIHGGTLESSSMVFNDFIRVQIIIRI